MGSCVSRRIPVLKLPVKARKDVDTPNVSADKTKVHVADNSAWAALRSNSLVVEDVSKNTAKTVKGSESCKDVVKKPLVQNYTADSLLVEATPVLNIATLADKMAGVAYVGSGLVSPSSPLLPSAAVTPVLSYSLYTPFILSDESRTKFQSASSVSRLPSCASTAMPPVIQLPTTRSPPVLSPQLGTGNHLTSTALQTSSEDNLDMFYSDSSVVDTEIVASAAEQLPSDCSPKHRHPVPKTQKNASSPGRRFADVLLFGFVISHNSNACISVECVGSFFRPKSQRLLFMLVIPGKSRQTLSICFL